MLYGSSLNVWPISQILNLALAEDVINNNNVHRWLSRLANFQHTVISLICKEYY